MMKALTNEERTKMLSCEDGVISRKHNADFTMHSKAFAIRITVCILKVVAMIPPMILTILAFPEFPELDMISWQRRCVSTLES